MAVQRQKKFHAVCEVYLQAHEFCHFYAHATLVTANLWPDNVELINGADAQRNLGAALAEEIQAVMSSADESYATCTRGGHVQPCAAACNGFRL